LNLTVFFGSFTVVATRFMSRCPLFGGAGELARGRTVQRVISAGTLPVAVSSKRPATCTTFSGSSALMSKSGGQDETGSRKEARNEWKKHERSPFTAMSVVRTVLHSTMCVWLGGEDKDLRMILRSPLRHGEPRRASISSGFVYLFRHRHP
jgi:hypothetical protein